MGSNVMSFGHFAFTWCLGKLHVNTPSAYLLLVVYVHIAILLRILVVTDTLIVNMHVECDVHTEGCRVYNSPERSIMLQCVERSVYM